MKPSNYQLTNSHKSDKDKFQLNLKLE